METIANNKKLGYIGITIYILILVSTFLLFNYFYNVRKAYEYKNENYVYNESESKFKKYIYSTLNTSIIPDSCFTIPVKITNIMNDYDSTKYLENFIIYSERLDDIIFTPPSLSEDKQFYKYYKYAKQITYKNDIFLEYISDKNLFTIVVRRELNKALLIVRQCQKVNIPGEQFVETVLPRKSHKFKLPVIAYLPISDKEASSIMSSTNINVVKYFDPMVKENSIIKLYVPFIEINYSIEDKMNTSNTHNYSDLQRFQIYIGGKEINPPSSPGCIVEVPSKPKNAVYFK